MENKHTVLIVGAIVVIVIGYYIGKKTVEAAQNAGPPTKSIDELVKSLSGVIVPNSIGTVGEGDF